MRQDGTPRFRHIAPKLVSLPEAAEIVREPYHRTQKQWLLRGWEPVGRWAGVMLFDAKQISKWRGLWKAGKLRETLGPDPQTGKLQWVELSKLRKLAPSCPKHPPIPLYKWGASGNAPYLLRVADVHQWLAREKHAGKGK